MQQHNLQFNNGFHVVTENQRGQSATMALEAGESTGGPDNKHENSDQWLFVVKGAGEAVIANHTVRLKPHDLVLIEAGEIHEIKNTGSEPLETLNFYIPPEY